METVWEKTTEIETLDMATCFNILEKPVLLI
jgi:hypothetical protein